MEGQGFPTLEPNSYTMSLCPPIFEPTGAKPNWLVVPKHALFPTWKRMKCIVLNAQDCSVWQKFTGSFESREATSKVPFLAAANAMWCIAEKTWGFAVSPCHSNLQESCIISKIIIVIIIIITRVFTRTGSWSLFWGMSYGASPMWVKEVVTTKARSSKWHCLLSDMLADISSSRNLHMSVSC